MYSQLHVSDGFFPLESHSWKERLAALFPFCFLREFLIAPRKKNQYKALCVWFSFLNKEDELPFVFENVYC